MDLKRFDMINRVERIAAITEDELASRWNKLRRAMEKKDLGAVCFTSDPAMIWWMTLSSSKMPDIFIFPLEGDPIAVYKTRRTSKSGFDPYVFPGRTPVEGTVFNWIENRNDISGQEFRDICRGMKVGIVGMRGLQTWFGDLMVSEGIEFEDFSHDMDLIKYKKSEFDQDLLRMSAKMHCDFHKAIPSVLRRGRTEKEVASELHELAMNMGSSGEDMCLLIHSFDLKGNSTPMGLQYPPYREYKDGDLIEILLETSGPGGLFTACARYYAFGNPEKEFMDRYNVACEANDLAGKLLRPGATLRGTADKVNEFIRSKGFYTDNCCYLHGMNYTMGEYPVLTDNSISVIDKKIDEDIPIEAFMQSLAHPHVGKPLGQYTDREAMVRVIDTWYITDEKTYRATSIPRDVTVL